MGKEKFARTKPHVNVGTIVTTLCPTPHTPKCTGALHLVTKFTGNIYAVSGVNET